MPSTANHLSPQDRQSAKSLLENQRSVLRQRVQSHLDAAYGLDPLIPGSLDTVHDLEPSERFVSLWPGFEPRPPVAANLAGAMNHLVSQALDHEFPAAPQFEAEIKSSNLKKVFEVVSQAALVDGRPSSGGQGPPAARAEHRQSAQARRDGPRRHALRARPALEEPLHEEGGGDGVRRSRSASSASGSTSPSAMGLPKEAENLVILIYALQTNQSFFIHEGPFPQAALGNLPDLCVLRAEKLPPQEQWDTAIERAGSIFGVAASPLLNSSNVSSLVAGVRKKVSDGRTTCQSYCQKLRDRLEKLGLPLADSDRLKTATATLRILEKLHLSADGAVVGALASAEVATSESAMGECLNKAGTLAGDARRDELGDLRGDREPHGRKENGRGRHPVRGRTGFALR